MQNLSPDKILGCTLKEGDTQKTLSRSQREFCIAVFGPALDTTIVRSTFEKCTEKGLAVSARRFISNPVSEPLVDAGFVDSLGRLVQDEWSRMFHDRCKDCGWGYAPKKITVNLSLELKSELKMLQDKTVSGEAPTASVPAASQVPRTGQTTCYDTGGNVIVCASMGQDGEIQAGVDWPDPRFIDNDDSTVTDSLTGLEWTQNANLAGTTKTWKQALDYVKTLNTGGHSDWRLPNKKELRSLVDYAQYNPALPEDHPFTNIQLNTIDFYWSSTTYADGPDYAWVVYMGDGDVHVGGDGKAGDYYVWPVRAGQVDNLIISTTTTTTVPASTARPRKFWAQIIRSLRVKLFK